MTTTPQHILDRIQAVKEQKLKTLNLSNYRITPEEKLREIPVEVFELTWLTELDLSNNQITSLPEAVTRLQNLSYLNLSDNQITSLPEAITRLQNLSTLDLSDNEITSLPEAIARLQNLSTLYLSNNEITSLPEDIARLQNLSTLGLSNNKITNLPEAIARLQNLSFLVLSGNPIKNPPLEVVEKGIKAIRDYFRQLSDQGKDYLYEAKLLIVGEGGAGKTTLAKKIENHRYQLKEEDSTQGIEVKQWFVPMTNGLDFRINIWDFGGQEIYHATHQFFLTKRSLYALVADSRKEDTDFYYWLNVVELLSDNSPVLIVKNEKQDRRREINERELRGQFTNLEKILATNLATNRGLKEILNEIKHYIKKLPHIGSALPKTWVRVREALESDARNYISLDEYLNICEQNGFTLFKDKLQLSGYLHDLGVCLHFQEDPLLKKTVILKPKWGTDAVYKVLDNQQVIKNFGRFTKSDLANIWSDDDYATMHDELLQLMINFKLCYKIPGQHNQYIAPQLLSVNSPDYDWNDNNNLILRYTYEFMPKGILIQFIVVMHQLIDQQRYVWRSGVILSKDNTKAEVIEYYDKREIKIRVAGRHKRDLLTIVTHELDKIHQSFNRLKYHKLIPCNCEVCKGSQNPHFYKFESLKRRIADKIPEIECDVSYQKVSVLRLIDDVMVQEKPATSEKPDYLHSHTPFTFINQNISQSSVNINQNISQSSKQETIIMTEPSKPEETSKQEVQVTLPWAYRNGLFYLLLFSIVFNTIGIFAGLLPIYSLIITIIGSVILILLIGVLQLRQDDRLSEKSFVELVKMVLKQLPLLGNLLESFKRNK
ncbi:MAG TPA: leucine-rich repeat protein [Nostocaceae cyanobacterium]|nr:leucine-rich repeat protein [Nostocaceae cyanobacterium]